VAFASPEAMPEHVAFSAGISPSSSFAAVGHATRLSKPVASVGRHIFLLRPEPRLGHIIKVELVGSAAGSRAGGLRQLAAPGGAPCRLEPLPAEACPRALR
jgi:hypothetical protein